MYLPYVHRNIPQQQIQIKPTSRDAKSLTKEDASQTSPMLVHRRCTLVIIQHRLSYQMWAATL